ncbi:MAG: septum formation initiator family protein [Paludibacteraceae bacterium]|nr:septum formation initiator family protein [Paludibacteraceae bacterium]
MKKIFRFLGRNLKYIVVIVTFTLILLYAQPYNIRARMRYTRQIQQLEQEIAAVKQKTAKNKTSQEQLGTDPEDLERFARERYHMKAGNEDLYIIYDKTK